MAIRVGLQLSTVREALRFDPVGTIAKVAEAGYRFLELSGQDANTRPVAGFGHTADQLRSLADRDGVQFVGGQVINLDADNIDAVVSFYRDLGADHITIPIDYFPTPEALKQKAHLYNVLGEVAARHDLRLYYLNHYHEFQEVGGEVVLDGLLARTDPNLLWLALSPYWLMRGLVNPIDAFRRYRARIGLIEQADFPLNEIDKLDMWHFYRHHPIARNIDRSAPLKGGEIENIHPVQCTLFTEIGEGIVKLQEIIDEANDYGQVSYVMLRQDFTRLPSEFDSIRTSLMNYKRVRGVVWA